MSIQTRDSPQKLENIEPEPQSLFEYVDIELVSWKYAC